MDLKFSVNKQIITRIDNEQVVSDSKNYLYADFEFTEQWTGTKTAIFKNKDKAYSVILENDRCLVPWEVIKEYEFLVSVFCGDLITTNEASVGVKKSGYVEGETPADPTPDVYEHILKLLNDISIGQVSEESIAKAVNEYMTEHPVEMTGYATEEYVNDAIDSEVGNINALLGTI